MDANGTDARVRCARAQMLQLIAASSIGDLGVWMLLPYISLQLAEQGLNPALIGVAVGVPWLALLLTAPLVLRLIHLTDALFALRLGLVLQAGAVATLLCEPGMATWLLAVFVLGAGMGPCWVVPDCWITHMAPAAHRGRWVSIYETANGGSIGLGPLALSLAIALDVDPFALALALFATALLMTLGLFAPPGLRLRAPSLSHLLEVVRSYPMLLLCAGLAGLLESGAVAMLPVHGIGIGFDTTTVALLVAAIGLGNVVVQYPIGVLCDSTGVGYARAICVLGLLAGLALMGAPGMSAMALLAVCFLWGGLAGSLYTCAVVESGALLSGNALFVAATGMMVGYTAGGLAGPAIGGLGLALHPGMGLFVALSVPLLLGALWMVQARWATRSGTGRPRRTLPGSERRQPTSPPLSNYGQLQPVTPVSRSTLPRSSNRTREAP